MLRRVWTIAALATTESPALGEEEAWKEGSRGPNGLSEDGPPFCGTLAATSVTPSAPSLQSPLTQKVEAAFSLFMT